MISAPARILASRKRECANPPCTNAGLFPNGPLKMYIPSGRYARNYYLLYTSTLHSLLIPARSSHKHRAAIPSPVEQT